MSRALLRAGLIAAFLLVVVAALLAVRASERTLTEGRIVLIELAPVDPRSLMQGDYMALAFAVDRELAEKLRSAESTQAVRALPRFAHLKLDVESRARLAGYGDAPPPSDADLVGMRIRSRHGVASIGPNAFFFQEGKAERFEAARWGEFRVAADGKALLTHLRDAELKRLGEIER